MVFLRSIPRDTALRRERRGSEKSQGGSCSVLYRWQLFRANKCGKVESGRVRPPQQGRVGTSAITGFPLLMSTIGVHGYPSFFRCHRFYEGGNYSSRQQLRHNLLISYHENFLLYLSNFANAVLTCATAQAAPPRFDHPIIPRH